MQNTIRYGRTRREEAARRTRAEGAGGAREQGRGAAEGGKESRCVSASANLKATRTSRGSIFVDATASSGGSVFVVGVPKGLAACTQKLAPGTINKFHADNQAKCGQFVFHQKF